MAKKHLFRSIMLIFIITVLSLSSCGYKEPVETTLRVFTVCEHEPGDWQVDREPTLDDTGAAHVECIHCGFVLDFKSSPKLSLTKDEIYEQLKPSLVRIYSYYDSERKESAYGSGFFIDEHGTFITNAHVVEDCYYVSLPI